MNYKPTHYTFPWINVLDLVDGASNMMGKKKGLVVLLKKDYPQIIGVHCLCHRLELSFKDALKKNAVYDRLVTMLLGIYYFYKNSPLQRKTLRKTFDASIQKPTKLPFQNNNIQLIGFTDNFIKVHVLVTRNDLILGKELLHDDLNDC